MSSSVNPKGVRRLVGQTEFSHPLKDFCLGCDPSRHLAAHKARQATPQNPLNHLFTNT